MNYFHHEIRFLYESCVKMMMARYKKYPCVEIVAAASWYGQFSPSRLSGGNTVNAFIQTSINLAWEHKNHIRYCNCCITLGYDVKTFEFPSQKQERKEGWEPIFASNLTLNFRPLIQPYSSGLLNSFCRGGLAWLSVSELGRKRT